MARMAPSSNPDPNVRYGPPSASPTTGTSASTSTASTSTCAADLAKTTSAARPGPSPLPPGTAGPSTHPKPTPTTSQPAYRATRSFTSSWYNVSGSTTTTSPTIPAFLPSGAVGPASPSSVASASTVGLGRAPSRSTSSTSGPGRTSSFTRMMDALEAARMADDSSVFTTTDHSTTRETLLTLTVHPTSPPPTPTSPAPLVPLPPDVLSTLHEATLQTNRRLVVVLSIPALGPAIRRARRRRRWFGHVQDLVRTVYMACEKAKQQTGKLLLIVDVGIQGWSEDVDPKGWKRTITAPTAGPASNSVPSDSPNSDPGTGGRPRTADGSGSKDPAGQKDQGLVPSTVYDIVALGGTFDHLHSGHRILLTMAAWLASERLIVGITDEALLKKKQHRDLLQPLALRTKLVHRFLSFLSPSLNLSLPPLQDVFGPTATDRDIKALVVSRETLPGAEAIDAEREKRKFSKLDRFVVEVVGGQGQQGSLGDKDDDIKQFKMGSTAIRGWIAEQLQHAQDHDRTAAASS